MRRSTSLFTLLAFTALAGPALSAPSSPSPAVKPVPSALAADAPWRRVQWAPSLQAAQERARREGKPVLLFSLFGKLDQEFC